ncbi:MAG: hypothetical protein Kow0047_25460 [Anaerolineae bacterium]
MIARFRAPRAAIQTYGPATTLLGLLGKRVTNGNTFTQAPSFRDITGLASCEARIG